MALRSTELRLYAATERDFAIALGAAAMSNVPVGQVTEDYQKVWKAVSSGSQLVLAVGAAALTALYYNPHHWSNPDYQPGGHTPFLRICEPRDELPGVNYFVNAAGRNAVETAHLASVFVYYAVTGQFPCGYANHPHPISPCF